MRGVPDSKRAMDTKNSIFTCCVVYNCKVCSNMKKSLFTQDFGPLSRSEATPVADPVHKLISSSFFKSYEIQKNTQTETPFR